MDPISYILVFGVILFVGIILTALANKTNIPPALLLLLTGIILSNIFYKGKQLVSIPREFVTTIGILALIVIVFYSSSKLKLKEIDNTYQIASKLVLLIIILNLVILTPIFIVIFKTSLLLSIILATLLIGTSSDIVLTLFSDVKLKIVEIIKIESVINTPLVILIPLILADFSKIISSDIIKSASIIIQPLLQQIMGGIGTGFVIGAIFFKFMKKYYSSTLSPLMALSSAIITYGLAIAVNGNPIIAVTTLGIMYGIFSIKAKGKITSFSKIFSELLEIIIFILVGTMINIHIGLNVFIETIIIFLIISIIRFLSIYVLLKGNLKEKIFATLAPSKGIAVAITALMLSTYNFPGMNKIIDITLIIMLYSIITSTIITRLSKQFIKSEIKQEEGFKK